MDYILTCGGGQPCPNLGNDTNMAVYNLVNTACMHSNRDGIVDFNTNVMDRRFRCNGNTTDINGNSNWTVNMTAIRCSNNNNVCVRLIVIFRVGPPFV